MNQESKDTSMDADVKAAKRAMLMYAYEMWLDAAMYGLSTANATYTVYKHVYDQAVKEGVIERGDPEFIEPKGEWTLEPAAINWPEPAEGKVGE